MMASYSQIVEQELKSFNAVEVKKIPITQNSLADALARLPTSEGIDELENVPIRRISNAAINQLENMLTTADLDSSWMDEIIQFLKDGRVLPDSTEAKKLRTRAARYTIIDNVLFNKSFSLLLLRCLRENEAQYALSEFHEGICGNHTEDSH